MLPVSAMIFLPSYITTLWKKWKSSSLDFNIKPRGHLILLCGLFNTMYPPNMSCSRSVDQMPSVGSEVFPSDMLWVMPESADLKQITKGNNSHWFIFSHVPNIMGRSWDPLCLTCPVVFPVCQRAFLRCSPGPVVEFTTLMERPEYPWALVGLFDQ